MSAGRTSQRTGFTNAPATIATPAAMTSAGDEPLRPAAAANAPPKATMPQRMRTPTPSAARRAMSPGVAARSLSGDEPPDEDAGTDQKGERDDKSRSEKPAAEKKGPGDEQQHHHARRSRAPRLRPSGAGRDGGRAVVARHEQQGGEVEQHAGAAEEGERDGADAEEDRVDVEVVAEPAADAADARGCRASA